MTAIRLQEVTIPSAQEIASYDNITTLTPTQKAVMHLHSNLYSDIDPERLGPVRYYQHLASQFTENSQCLAGVLQHGTNEEDVVAMTSFSSKGKRMEVHELIVAQSFRHHPELHVGSFVLASLIQIAKDSRVAQIELDSSCTEIADAFYKKFGFMKTSTSRRELKLRK